MLSTSARRTSPQAVARGRAAWPAPVRRSTTSSARHRTGAAAARRHRSGTAASQAPAPAAAPPQVQAPPKLPVFNRANQKLPAWLRVRGEFRERIEGFDGLGFTDGRDDCYCAQPRPRSTPRSRPAKSLSLPGAACRTRASPSKTVGPTGAPFRGPFDLRIGVRRRRRGQEPASRARLGRQELVVRRAAADRPRSAG